jgi:hypothetical protein
MNLKSQYQKQYGKDIQYMETSSSTVGSTESLVSSIPILQGTRERTTDISGIPQASNQIEREPTFEYEFSVCPSGGTPLFVTLWDRDDLSAAQRACCSNLSREQITYSPTGNAFFKVRDEDWCFRKEPFQHSWTRNKIETVKPKSSPTTADEILATL